MIGTGRLAILTPHAVAIRALEWRLRAPVARLSDFDSALWPVTLHELAGQSPLPGGSSEIDLLTPPGS
jgi:hypothetical protein